MCVGLTAKVEPTSWDTIHRLSCVIMPNTHTLSPRLLLPLVLIAGMVTPRAALASRGETRMPSRAIAAPSEAAAAATLIATLHDSLLIDGDNDAKADPGDTLRYTAMVTNIGGIDASVAFTQSLDANSVLSGSMRASPVGVNDSYNVLGNVLIDVPAAQGILANDFMGVPAASLSTPVSSTQGGIVTVAGDGGFTYEPPAGYEGLDTFVYTLTNATGVNTGTVSLTISGMIWFVDNNTGACSAGCDGRMSHPFTSTLLFNTKNDGFGNNPANGDTVFLYASNAAYLGPLGLRNAQRVIGQGASGPLASLAGVSLPAHSNLPATGGAQPRLAHTATAVTLAQNNTLRGFDLVNNGGTALFGNNFGTLTISDMSVTNTNGIAIALTNGAPTVTLRRVSATGGESGIALRSTTGSFEVAGDGADTTRGGNESGGVINAITGVDGNTADDGASNGVGIGVYLNNASNVTLARMRISNTANFGVNAESSSGIMLRYMTFSGAHGNALAGDEGSLRFLELRGANEIAHSTIRGGFTNNIRVDNNSGTLTALTIRDNEIRDSNSGLEGNDNIQIDLENVATVARIDIISNTLAAANGDHVQLAATGAISAAIVITGNTLIGGGGSYALGQGVVLGADTFDGTVIYNIANNTIQGALGGGAIVAYKGTGSGMLQGTISGNAIGALGVLWSGCRNTCPGIAVQNIGAGSHIATVTGNTILQASTHGIEIESGGAGIGSNTALSVTVTDNYLDAINFPMRVVAGIHVGNAALVCVDMRGNRVGGNSSGFSTVTQAISTTIRLPGYGGARDFGSGTFLEAQNSMPFMTSNTVSTGGGGFVGGSACAAPVIVAQSDTLTTAVAAAAPAGVTSDGRGGARKALFAPRDRAHSAGLLALTVDVLPPGESVIISVDARINDLLPLTIASVSTQGRVNGTLLTDDPDTGASADATVTQLDINAELQISAQASSAALFPGERLTYTIRYTNTGPQAAAGVMITDVLPAALTNRSYDSSSPVTPTGAIAVVLEIGTLEVDQGGVLTVSGVISNIATTSIYQHRQHREQHV